MRYGICNLSIVPLRLEPTDTSEMISQGLFGEHFTVLEKEKNWSKISLHFDGYEGYIDNKQYEEITATVFNQLSIEKKQYTAELIDFIVNTKNNQLITVPIGTSLPFFDKNSLRFNDNRFLYDGKVYSGKLVKEQLIKKALLFLNTPFLSGGKTPFGIDAAGFTQMVYKLCGHSLLREANQQATQGEVLSFIEESEPGDLAFFDNDEGEIIHAGIILKDYQIIHAYGKVRIDSLDHSGIYNYDTQKHTHKLRVIKKII